MQYEIENCPVHELSRIEDCNGMGLHEWLLWKFAQSTI